MSSIYQEGRGWAVRVRLEGKSVYQANFKTEKAAQKWAEKCEEAYATGPAAKGLGPRDTALALALRDYAYDYVRYQKGAKQAVTRINAYLEPVGLPLLKAVEAAPASAPESATENRAKKFRIFDMQERAAAKKKKPKGFELTESPAENRRLPRTFDGYRNRRLGKRATTLGMRHQLAAMRVAKIASHHIQGFVNAMKNDGLSTSTINNELAILSNFFNHARKVWAWSPLTNPCDNIKRESPDNQRDRVLTPAEEEPLALALTTCTNPYIAPYVLLSIETAMRKGELLRTAHWHNIDWEQRFLLLTDAKGGRRKVPLTREAVAVLQGMPNRTKSGRIFPMTADALDSAWERACKRAGITDLRIHDLRHTAATRHAKRLNGNIFLLKLITGHKSLSMLERYVNPSVGDVVAAFDAPVPAVLVDETPSVNEGPLPPNVLRLPVRSRRSA